MSEGETYAQRPALRGTRHMASAGHYAAAHAAFAVLEAGGNAVDAAVAGGIALGVVQPDIVNVAGVAPIMIRMADGAVWTVAGLGHWPAATDPSSFDGQIPEGLRRTIIPAAPDAWITALRRFGTMRFGEVVQAAIRLAEGFVCYPLLADMIASHEAQYARWPSNAAIFLPGGRPPRAGEIFVQADLARSLRYMADEEAAALGRGADREGGLEAARAAFYSGDIARAITRFHEEQGGWLTARDMSEYRSPVERAPSVRFAGVDVFTCGAWCQGPVLGQALNLLDPRVLTEAGHNSPHYLHLLTEALKLAFSDREAFYGDPHFVDVPLEWLLSAEYTGTRRKLIDHDRAWPDMPPHGEPFPAEGPRVLDGAPSGPPRDTSYISVVDRWGNAVSATPSDTSYDTQVIPGTGLCPSSRGSQSFLAPGHPSRIAPGKRPRLTPNPAMAVKPGEMVLPFGSPGGDVQCQAMMQALLNMLLFGMDPQDAVEHPRMATYSFPDSFEPHTTYPGRLCLESRIPRETGEALSQRGHQVSWWPERIWRAGAVCAIQADLRNGILTAGADPRRPGYAVGW
ncbi:gamma-glutamyltransferase family protein [Roseococcus sp. YIM B11640]|uniref:gamma-glutamyltransferase family protein n=1 Tax=Roseococcus sp. YIM B11640 TaxID=3133973 RepID=UPI003C7BDFDA